jgi:hypothetical protein
LAEQFPQARRAILVALNGTTPLPSVAQEVEFVTSVIDQVGMPTISRSLRYLDPGIDLDGVERRLREVATFLAQASRSTGITMIFKKVSQILNQDGKAAAISWHYSAFTTATLKYDPTAPGELAMTTMTISIERTPRTLQLRWQRHRS